MDVAYRRFAAGDPSKSCLGPTKPLPRIRGFVRVLLVGLNPFHLFAHIIPLDGS